MVKMDLETQAALTEVSPVLGKAEAGIAEVIPDASQEVSQNEPIVKLTEDPSSRSSSTNVNNTPQSGSSLSDEILFMKKQLEGLERQMRSRAPESGADDTKKSQESLSPEALEHQRMDECLYRHRKEWEISGDRDSWRLDTSAVDSVFKFPGHGYGSWPHVWKIYQEKGDEYKRPDPFDKKHQFECYAMDEAARHEYDEIIDFESRRSRLRKGFEWELDRLYLMEEIQKRDRATKEEIEKKDKKKTQQTAKKDADAGELIETIPEPQMKRMDWYAFKRRIMIKQKAFTIDILMGEPIIQNALLPYGSWFGYSRITSKAPKKSRSNVPSTARNPEESPLPERIRIHSGILLKIMGKILASDSLQGMEETPVVFTRPFKALAYCEEQLRRGCIELEKKFTVSSDSLIEESTEAENSKEQQPQGKDKGEPSAVPKPIIDEGEDEEDDFEDENEKSQDLDDDTGSLTALKHLRCLLQFIDMDIKPKRELVQRYEGRKVFFSDLWYAFRPGMEVISNDGKQAYRVVHVKSARHRVIPPWQQFHESQEEEGRRPEAPFSLQCVYIDFDGKNLGPVSKVFEFKRFEGQQDITSLEVFPLKFFHAPQSEFSEEEQQALNGLPISARSDAYRKKLIARGKKFIDVASVKHMYYAGPTLGIRDEVESQVVIDFETAFTVEEDEQVKWKPELELLVGRGTETALDAGDICTASCCRSDSVHDDTYVDNKQKTDYIDSLLPKENEAERPLLSIIPRPLKDLKSGTNKDFVISDDELAIMSYRVFGFVLRTRKWAKLDLAYLTNVQQPEAQTTPGSTESTQVFQNAFDRLVLQNKHKDMIVSLVSQHFRDKESAFNQREQFDIVRGKGKGLIILLHGEPGVGKTSTAEGVAEQFKKPLFQITCGDLGTTAKEVEKALETTFALANRWDCILLLDEADVFLSQRTKEDFQRNGLVAVFLRVMEYYAGILFLTTNRVGDFDEAFTSRIHVSLYYRPLESENTVKIFKLNLELIDERFKRKGRRIDIKYMEIGAFAADHFEKFENARWNGRQIRNACQTALALAEYEAQDLAQKSADDVDPLVTLDVAHFEVVRDAYVEFTSYIDDLYGTNASKRAQEDRLRTARFGDRSRKPGASAIDQRTEFAQMARGQHPVDHQYRSSQLSNPDFQAMSRPRMTPQPGNYTYGGYQNAPLADIHPGYNQLPTQGQPNLGDEWRPRGHTMSSMTGDAPHDHPRYQNSPRPPAQRPITPEYQARVAQGVESMYEPSMSQGHTPESSRNFAQYPAGYGQ